jgi:general secretion pathway protein G
MNRRRSRRQDRAAFTLMEVLLVLVILVVLGSLAVSVFSGTQRSAMMKAAQVQIDTWTGDCERYKLDMNSFPASLEDLRTNSTGMPSWSGPYTDKQIPPDPWGNQYQYDPAGARHNGEKPDIMSNGPDGAAGTEDDILNR